MPSAPKSSIDKNTEAIGQFTTPQNIDTKPIAAPKPELSPNKDDTAQPKVEPIKNVGTISPPLKPAEIVIAVKIILSKKSHVLALPDIAFEITSMPAPL